MTVVADIQKHYNVATQTMQMDSNLCLRCSNDLNSPSHVNSPFAMKLVKSSDSVISETKSSVSDSTQNEKLFSPAKKDQDLTINPILSHHRLCERANNVGNHNNEFLPMLVSPKLTHISSSSSSVSKAAGNVCSPKSNTLGLERKLDVVQNDSYESHENMTKLSGVKYENDVDLLLSTDPMINDSIANDTDNDDLLCNEKTYLLEKTEIAPSPIFRKSNNVASRSMILRTPELNRNKNATTSPAGPSSCSTAGKNSSESYAIHDTDKVTNKSDSLRGAGNGSTNSLWSRTSSRDGFKMFENFNRNLIKTIKAENPKMKGPRICALRIQTGSNNILIDDGLEDNMEIISPVVYTRRPRLLDEELDDEKDVTLAYDCKISMVMSDIQKKPIILNEKSTDMKFHESEIVLPLYEKQNKTPEPDMKAPIIAQPPTVPSNQQQQQQPLPNYAYSRTTTNDSVLSEVDLKRQQLSRVAEWVQNNSKINDVENNFPIKETDGDLINLLDTQNFPSSQQDNKHLIFNRTTNEIHSKSNLNNNNSENATEKGHKNLLDNVNITTATDVASSSSLLNKKTEIAQHAPPAVNNDNFTNNPSNKNNSINLYKYFKLYSSQQSDYEDDEDLQYENGNDDDCCEDDYDEEEASEKNLDDENQIDLAQMEYNVKQFLLKQNEWSIHNKMAPGGATRLSTNVAETTTKVKPRRTETNL